MAVITYTRSSSLNNWGFCQQQYFLTYNLGLLKKSNKKADQGSAVHKVLEWLAYMKQYQQDNPASASVDVDGVSYDYKDFLTPYFLDSEEVDAINKSRKAASIYKTSPFIQYGHIRYGMDIVEHLISRACDYYGSKSDEKWAKANIRDCWNWTWMGLDYLNGAYDPRKRNIKAPERQFDLPIDADWALYDYGTINGEEIKGRFAIKGTIDLITELSPDTLEIVDWKTGQRLNWSTGEEKTYAKLCKDIQLMLYYYAASRLYPEYKNIILTIFYIRDGGPFTLSFERSDMDYVEDQLKQHFLEVQSSQLPKLCSPTQTDFKCTKLCQFYKDNWENTNQNQCRFIHEEIKKIGIDNVIEKYKNPDFKFSSYQQPGQ